MSPAVTVLAFTASTTLGRRHASEPHLLTNRDAAGAVTLTLPSGEKGMRIHARKVTAQTFSLARAGSDTILDSASSSQTSVAVDAELMLLHDGTAWLVVGETLAEMAVLSGITATANEINVLAGVTAGTSAAGDGLVLDADGDIVAGPVVLADIVPGAGADGAETIEHAVIRAGGLFHTTILVDLAGLNSGGTAGDIIGEDPGVAACHLGQITAAKNGTIVAGRITCLETPATGDDDIDLYSATEATGAEDAAISGLTGTQLCNSGDLTAGTVVMLTAFPAANSYLYLVAQTGDANATYSAGKLLIELWGK